MYETIEHVLHSAKLLGNIIDLLFDAVEPRFDGGEIVTVAAGLFEDATCDQLLAFDVKFERSEFLSGHVGRHRSIPS